MKIYDMHCDVLCKLRKDEKEGRGVSLRRMNITLICFV